MMRQLEWLDEKYCAVFVDGKRSVDVWDFGTDLKVSLMSDGVYNDAFERPSKYSIKDTVLADVRYQAVEMTSSAYADEEGERYGNWDEILDEWIESFDDDTYNSLVATIEGLANDLMKFAKGGRLYAENLKGE